MAATKKPLALYVHIPFCKAKCTYCDFYSLVGRDNDIPQFIEALLKEIAAFKQAHLLDNHFIDSIFFGGGTPNLLSPRYLDMVLKALLGLTTLGSEMEIGMEINPGEASYQDLVAYGRSGINRISIGMQSFQPELLRFMSRIHTAEKSVRTYEDVRRAGFDNVSGDLIFAIPGQTREIWEADLKKLITLGPEHISTYSLTVEEGTALSRWVRAGHVQTMEESIDTGMYAWGRDFLEAAGYPNYEISNHAKPGYACRHNLNYWTGVEYLGFGPAAHSYFNTRRHWNVANLDAYLTHFRLGTSLEAASEKIDKITAMNEMILTELRLSRGIDLSLFKERHGIDFMESRKVEIGKWYGKLNVKGNHLSLTAQGWSLVDEITSDLMF